MSRVRASVSYVELEGDYGPVEGVEVTCLRCGHSEACFGTGEQSIKRCAVQLRENCPNSEENFYIPE